MFGMSAERNEVERTPRIAQCGHAPRIDSGGTPPQENNYSDILKEYGATPYFWRKARVK